MKMIISNQENTNDEEEIFTSSLTYNYKSSTFEIPAGGYLITTPKELSPFSFTVQKETLFLRFATSEEAKDFCNWLKWANQHAEESFTRMLD
jgi:hypothetical protein